jgi:Flp pilus assembly protein TadD
LLSDDISQAVNLLKDDNLVWSGDFEAIRKNLALLLAKTNTIEYAELEPEIGDIALNLIRERGTNVRGSTTT